MRFGRKFWLTVGVVTLLFLYRAVDWLDQSSFVKLLEFTLGGYFGANVGHRAVEVAAPLIAKNKTEKTA